MLAMIGILVFPFKNSNIYIPKSGITVEKQIILIILLNTLYGMINEIILKSKKNHKPLIIAKKEKYNGFLENGVFISQRKNKIISRRHPNMKTPPPRNTDNPT